MSEAIREKLRSDIEQSDVRLLRMINALVEEYKATDCPQIEETPENRNAEERRKYLLGERRSYTPEEMKALAWQKSARYRAAPATP